MGTASVPTTYKHRPFYLKRIIMTREEAIRIVKTTKYYSKRTYSEFREALSILVPELYESEDERMRKCLIHYLRGEEDECEFNIPDMLAYLEKQKELHIPWYDYKKSKEAGYTIVPNEEYDRLKQKEQNLVPCNAQCGECPCFISGMNYQKEQKPAEWSRQSIIDALTKWLTEKIAPLHKKSLDGTITEREEMFEAALLEMRSLVNSPDFRIGKDISVEWSEEDEKMMRGICTILSGLKDIVGEEAGKILNEKCYWLKSLRSQLKPEITDEEIEEMVTKQSRSSGTTKSEVAFYRNGIKDAIKRFGLRSSWKPSDEQMKALKECGRCKRDIESLYNDIQTKL